MAPPFENTITLVRRAKSGDDAALNALFSRYLQRIHHLVKLRLGPGMRGNLESQDIVQEALLRGFRSFSQFEMQNEGAFLHWLSRLVENAIRDKADYYAAAKRSVSEEIPLQNESEKSETDVLARIRGKDPTPSTILVRDEDLAKLDSAIEKLGADHREAILQRDIEGLSFKEIGDNMARSEDAARMLYARAKSELAKLLQPI